MEEKEMPIRGRGAFIAAALRKAQARPGPAAETSGAEASGDAEPPKPRGRAGLLATLKKLQAVKIGADGDSKPEPQSIPLDKSTSAPSAVSAAAQSKAQPETLPEDSTPKDFIGDSGKRVPGSANYIRLELEPGRGVFEYEVKFEPTVDSLSARSKILSKVIVQYSKSKTFDGHALYLPVKCFDRETFEEEHPFDKSRVTMTIIYKRQTRMDECIHLYNVLFKRIMKILEYKRVGRQFFDNRNPMPVPQHKLEIWPGYVTAVNEFSGGIMLCLDVQHRVLRTQNALQFMYEIMQGQRARAKELIAKGLIGTSVITRYNNASYVVHDITWDVNPSCSFDTPKGPVRFVDYFRNQYNATIEDLTQPMLINRATVRTQGAAGAREDRLIMLVPELSYMTGLSDAMRADMRIMRDIAQHTRVTPNQRMNSLRKFIASVEKSAEAREVLGAWGLRLAAATIDLQMRILDPETILFGGDVRQHGTDKADWTSAAMRSHVLSAVDFRRWLLVYTAQDERAARELSEALVRLGPRMGVHVAPPEMHRMKDDRTESYMQMLQQKIDAELQIVVVLCPTSRDDRYMAIKRVCCHKTPVASQVVLARTLRDSSRLPAVAQKIAMQMNCKMGGTLWSVKFPFRSWMICGIDVFHSKASTGKAVCGFVSSLNESVTRWYSSCCFHSSDKELGDHLKPLFIRALNEFRNANLSFPTHVVVYRDGVGDGQLHACREFEVRQFREALADMGLPDVRLVFVVVQKRITTRLFARERDRGEAANPPPGSIADQLVTRRSLYDFFLVSQHVRQGTVTPTHYVVLHNDASVKPDHVQRLSYKLCHMYYNWTGTVRVPAPCQYAHKLAYLIGQHVRAEHSTKLSSRLFYL